MFANESTLFDLSQANNLTLRILILVGVLLLCCSNAYADIEHGKRIYRENCAPCHGESGKGDGVGARSLPVRPADHTDGAAMSSRSDTFLRDVIAKGAARWAYLPSCRRGKGFLKIMRFKTWSVTFAAWRCPPNEPLRLRQDTPFQI